MCKASPGPRCFNSASKAYESALKKFEMAQEKSKEAYSQFDQSVGKGDPDNTYRLRIKYDLAKRDELKAEEKAQEAKNDMDATVGGMESLKSEVQRMVSNPNTPVSDIRSVQKRLTKAQKSYDKKMFEFDKEHGTVNGIAPSKYGDDEGIDMLAKGRNDCKKAYGSARTRKEKKELVKTLEKFDESIQHAILTKERIAQGLAHPHIKPTRSRVRKLNAEVEKRSEHEQKIAEAQTEFDNLVKRNQQFINDKSVAKKDGEVSMSSKDKKMLKKYDQECFEAKKKLNKVTRDRDIHEAIIMASVSEIENSNANANRLQPVIDAHKK